MISNLEYHIKRSAKQNRKSQELLYHEYTSTLYAIARKYMGNHQDAEEVLQDAWVSIFKSLHTYKDEGKFEGWLKTIVIRTAWKAKKKSIPEYTSDLEDSIFLTVHTPLDKQILDQLTIDELMKYLHKIPTASRQVYTMHVLDGYDHNEISEIMEITRSTSRAHLAKARAIMRNIYSLLTQEYYASKRI